MKRDGGWGLDSHWHPLLSDISNVSIVYSQGKKKKNLVRCVFGSAAKLVLSTGAFILLGWYLFLRLHILFTTWRCKCLLYIASSDKKDSLSFLFLRIYNTIRIMIKENTILCCILKEITLKEITFKHLVAHLGHFCTVLYHSFCVHFYKMFVILGNVMQSD